jgi:hypothetical protein
VIWSPAWELESWKNEPVMDIRQPVRTSVEHTVRIRYQETTNEDIDEFMCAAVTIIFKVCKPVRLIVTCSYELCV